LMTLYLRDAMFLDWSRFEIKKTCLAVETGPRGSVSFLKAVPPPEKLALGERILDCTNRIVTRSFGCGHHHIYSTLARGMPAPQELPVNFVEILKHVWWRLDKCLDLEMIEASALASAIYCAKNGVTLIIDHHASPFAVHDSLFTIAKAFNRVGISHLLCYEISDRDGEGPREAGLAETDAYLSAGGQGHVGLHASFTVGDDLLQKAIALAHKHDTGLHMHVAEDPADQEEALKRYGRRVVERLERAGALKLKKSILSHCIHLSQREKELIRESGVWVAQNVESNQNNNVGLTGYKWITGNTVLGTDGMHSDMLRSAKAAFFVGRSTEAIGFDEIYRRFRDVHRYTKEFGMRGDGDNNLVVLEYDSPTEMTTDNFLGHFVYGIESRHVAAVICQGKLIVEDGSLTTVNEAEVLAHAREMGRRLWDKMRRREAV
jgi:cytosine/adenosine deaminase-related metal-dependent hydrolase